MFELPNCDYEEPMMVSVYPKGDGTFECRCIVCARCHKHTGNSHQGHFWGFCKKGHPDQYHFCCPDDCELEA